MGDSKNKVTLLGRLTRDGELKQTGNGRPMLRFGLATNEKWTTEAGEKKEAVQFHNCVFFSKRADGLAPYMKKGLRVDLEGKIEYREFEKDGQKVRVAEINVFDVILLDSPRNASAEEGEAPAPKSATKVANGGGAKKAAPSAAASSHSDDEVPF